jgi:hypothetical protein
MIRRHRTQDATDAHAPRAFDDVHEWALSLPWVVERPYSVATPGVRALGVDCEPLGERAELEALVLTAYGYAMS